MKRLYLLLALCLCLLTPSSATQVFFPVSLFATGSAVDLQFANNIARNCTSFSCLSNTNSTGGYCTDSTGVLHLIGSNTLRVCSGTGVLVEQASTNLALQSQAMATTPWSGFGAGTGTSPTITNNSTTAPDGSNTATLIAFNRTTSTGQSNIVQTFTGTVATYTEFVYIKASTGGDVGKQLTLAFYNGSAIVGISTITLTASWAEVPTTATLVASANCQLLLGLFNGSGTTQTGTVNALVWGYQLELSSFASSYIPTTTIAASRSADNISISGLLATTLAGSIGTIVANTNSSQQSLAGTIVDANGTVLLGKTSGNAGTTAVGATLSTGNIGAWSGANDLGLAWNASGGAIQLNIGTIVTDSTARTPPATFHLGSTSGSSAFFNGYITRLTAYTTKLGSPQ